MEVVIYSRVSSESQDNERQIVNLKEVAQNRGQHVRRVFQEISGTTETGARNEFKSLIELFVLGLSEDIIQVAKDDILGRKLQDAKLLIKKRAPKKS